MGRRVWTEGNGEEEAGPWPGQRNAQSHRRGFRNKAPVVDASQTKTFPKKEQRDETNSQPSKFFVNAKLKSWRVVLRNLPFKTTAEDLQNACSKIGPFTEIVLPKCKDKRYPKSCAGFAFIQFKNKVDAEKARVELNESDLHGRQIAADWALDKDTYETMKHDEEEDLKKKVKTEKVEEEEEEAGGEEEEDEDEDEEMEEDDGDEDEEMEEDEEVKNKNWRNREDPAVSEGRAVFLRNLSFDTTEETLKKKMAKFGDVKLALICKFAESGHSKGSAFVHFSTAEEAKKAVEAARLSMLSIDNRYIQADFAISRQDVHKKEREMHDTQGPKDKRNILLLRAGIIRDGTAAAAGMSKQDSEKRSRLADSARRKMANLHMFVSPLRLAVHNLPQSVDDRQLRRICKEAAGPAGVITECRVWRDQHKLDVNNQPRSCGFGFVAFSSHSMALQCLQKLNNNPDIFTNERRPIVEFSIENLKALQLREGRKLRAEGEPQRKKKKLEKGQIRGAASEDVIKQVEQTTRKMRQSGMKPLPLKMSAKVRSKKTSAKGGAKKAAPKKKSEKPGGGRPGSSAAAGGAVPKSRRSGRAAKRTLSKYLALT